MFKSSKGVPFKMDAWAAKQGVTENFITDCDIDIRKIWRKRMTELINQ